MKSSQLRTVVRNVLRKEGYAVALKPGQGYVPGARLLISQGNMKRAVAVKASQERALGFTRLSDKRWRTLHAVKQVVAIVPTIRSHAEAEIFLFNRRPLVNAFDRAWSELQRSGRAIGFNAPVFIPLDGGSQKNLGHHEDNLKERAFWSCTLSAAELKEFSVEADDYIATFRSRYAAEHGVAVDRVKIEIEEESHD